jgi:predicted nucleic acid-binding protein
MRAGPNFLPGGAFLDTSFFVAIANESDRDHKRIKILSDKLRKGEFRQPYTSDYVFDESITTAFVRTGRLDRAVKVGKMILGNESEKILPFAKIIHVDESSFTRAWGEFSSSRFSAKGLSFTDHTILVQMRDLSIETLVSLDSGFDGLVSRIPR